MSRIDRIFCSLPGWSLTHLAREARAMGSPGANRRAKLSDHSATLGPWSRGVLCPPENGPDPGGFIQSVLDK
eukprot:7773977-Pyramimonas_sp.AAC.1